MVCHESQKLGLGHLIFNGMTRFLNKVIGQLPYGMVITKILLYFGVEIPVNEATQETHTKGNFDEELMRYLHLKRFSNGK